jgi:hypothetical protein
MLANPPSSSSCVKLSTLQRPFRESEEKRSGACVQSAASRRRDLDAELTKREDLIDEIAGSNVQLT